GGRDAGAATERRGGPGLAVPSVSLRCPLNVRRRDPAVHGRGAAGVDPGRPAAAHTARPLALQQRVHRAPLGEKQPLTQTTATRGSRKSIWLTAILIVLSVSAVSLALGLLVVGPMIQQRMETPSPTLAASAPVPAAPAVPVAAAAEVQIKERIL